MGGGRIIITKGDTGSKEWAELYPSWAAIGYTNWTVVYS